jgi:hypothetical protein
MHPNLLPIFFSSKQPASGFAPQLLLLHFLSFSAAAGYQSVALTVPVAFLSSHQAATQFYSPYPTLIQSLSSFQITSIWKNSPKPISRNSRPPEPREKKNTQDPRLRQKYNKQGKYSQQLM